MCCQNLETSKKEENQTRNKNSWKSSRRHERDHAARRGQGSCVPDAGSHLRARQQHRLQAAVSDVNRLWYPRLLVRVVAGLGLLSQHGYHAQGCKAAQRDDWSWESAFATDWLGTCRILPSRTGTTIIFYQTAFDFIKSCQSFTFNNLNLFSR